MEPAEEEPSKVVCLSDEDGEEAAGAAGPDQGKQTEVAPEETRRPLGKPWCLWKLMAWEETPPRTVFAGDAAAGLPGRTSATPTVTRQPAWGHMPPEPPHGPCSCGPPAHYTRDQVFTRVFFCFGGLGRALGRRLGTLGDH